MFSKKYIQGLIFSKMHNKKMFSYNRCETQTAFGNRSDMIAESFNI